jgi:hypothetical protein
MDAQPHEASVKDLSTNHRLRCSKCLASFAVIDRRMRKKSRWNNQSDARIDKPCMNLDNMGAWRSGEGSNLSLLSARCIDPQFKGLPMDANLSG